MTGNTAHYRARILVVDDEAVIADTLVQILEHHGYSASAAYDGREALQLALLNPPQVLVSDVMMPGMTGIDLGIAVRRIFPDCKIILFSGQAASRDLIAEALSIAGHFRFLEKPVHPTTLLNSVERSLELHNPV